jgi:hypothetical protein
MRMCVELWKPRWRSDGNTHSTSSSNFQIFSGKILPSYHGNPIWEVLSQIPPSSIQHVQGFNGQSCLILPSDSEDIGAACFVPLQKGLLENATMTMYSQAYPCTRYLEQVNSFQTLVSSPVRFCQLSARPLGLLLWLPWSTPREWLIAPVSISPGLHCLCSTIIQHYISHETCLPMSQHLNPRWAHGPWTISYQFIRMTWRQVPIGLTYIIVTYCLDKIASVHMDCTREDIANLNLVLWKGVYSHEKNTVVVHRLIHTARTEVNSLTNVNLVKRGLAWFSHQTNLVGHESRPHWWINCSGSRLCLCVCN